MTDANDQMKLLHVTKEGYEEQSRAFEAAQQRIDSLSEELAKSLERGKEPAIALLSSVSNYKRRAWKAT